MDALGCNVAGGIIDAFFYLLNSLGQRGNGVALLKQLRRTSEPGEARCTVADALPPLMASLLGASRDRVVEREIDTNSSINRVASTCQRGLAWSTGVFLVVFLSLFPVVVPFIFVSNARLAHRISNVEDEAAL